LYLMFKHGLFESGAETNTVLYPSRSDFYANLFRTLGVFSRISIIGVNCKLLVNRIKLAGNKTSSRRFLR
jgi:hypothetical protein